MPIRGQYSDRVEASLDEAEQRYMAAAAAYTKALLEEDVVARLMPYREIDYPDGDLPVAPLTRAYPAARLHRSTWSARWPGLTRTLLVSECSNVALRLKHWQRNTWPYLRTRKSRGNRTRKTP